MTLPILRTRLFSTYSRIRGSRRFRGAGSVFISTTIANIASYIYTIVMGRMLGPAQYGLLVVVISAVSIFAIPTQALNTMGINFAAQFAANKKYGYIKQYAYRAHRRILPILAVSLILSLIFSPILQNIFNLPSFQFVLWVVLFSGISYLSIVASSLIQGLQLFKSLSILIIIGGLFKLIIGVSGVLLISNAKMAAFCLFLSALLTYSYSLKVLRQLKGRMYKKQFDTSKLKRVALPSLITFASLTLLTYQDVLVVKRYFNDIDVGYYGALTTLGRISFFFCLAMITSLFPIISEAHLRKQHFQRWVAGSLIAVLVIGGLFELGYLLFPRIFILSLYGEQYLSIAPLLGFVGIQSLIYSLSYVTSMVLLAQNANDAWIMQILAASLHLALLIRLPHSLFAVIFIGIFVNALLLMMLFGYYITHNDIVKKIYYKFS